MDLDFFKKTRILDGGMGQELLSKGLISKGTLWSASAILDKKFHNLVVETHLSFINSGADVILTNTFSTRRIRLIKNKVEEHFNYVNEQSCLLALEAKKTSKKNILIAGSLPAQDDTYLEDTRNSKQIEKDFYDQAKIIGPHVDFFYLDVISSGREIDIASNVALKLSKPVLVGMHLKKNNLLPSGETISEVFQKYKNNNWIGLISACVSPEIVESSISEIIKLNIPFGFKANLWGIDEPTPVKTFNTAKPNEIGTNPNIALGKRNDISAKKFYDFSKKIKENGATILGGCCETNPKHKGNRMNALANELQIKDYLRALMKEYPSVKDIVPSQTQIDEIRKVLKSFSDELDRMRLTKGEIDRGLRANKTHLSKKINEYSNIINEELNVARSELKELTKPESEKLQRQMLTLSNRLTKLEKRLKIIEDDWSDVDC